MIGEPRALAQKFVRFAEVECRGASPLYESLAHSIADHDEILELAAHAAPGQPAPNLLFAAVHVLLMREPETPLAEFYPSLTAAARPPGDAYPGFRTFCRRHAEKIRALLESRRVQTNEVRRCAYLFPAFAAVARLAGGRPLALIEIGASAGLNLLWDRYAYRYDDEAVYGALESPVLITCQLRGDGRPPLARQLPTIAARVGVDLHPVDVMDADAVRWLEALVWPEERQRADLLRTAVALARRDPPRLVSGDGVVVLPDILAEIPAEIPVCVFHSHTVNQFSPEQRERFTMALASLARTRTLYRVSAEWLGAPVPQLTLTTWSQGRADERLLARCDHHGRWLEWLD
ncbi:MAG: DUF2332 domain-containing protein [Candidatus Rokuibacteriota bacterium]|nr:MAG: DUF2332 domain-containing protein [Candidatus Rokubacteria bacterium]